MGHADIGWKEALQGYFEPAMALLFPKAHAQIDWSRGYEFLDKELQQILRDGKIGPRFVDKLVRLWLLDGNEKWILVHLDVQGQVQENFGYRMYVYNYRLFDVHDRNVASMAILADDDPEWRPDGFGYNLLDCEIDFRFPTAKLLDFVGKEAELEASSNPFSVVILAWLEARRTANDDNQRRVSKVRLIRSLYERGFLRNDVQKLFRLINWLVILPKALEDAVWRDVVAIQKEKQVEHLTVIEQIWLEKGTAEGMAKGVAQGIAEGVAQGKAEGVAQGKAEGVAQGKAEGVAQGKAEGVAQGKAEGLAQGRAPLETAIETILQIKFGSIAAVTLMADIRPLTLLQLNDLLPTIKNATTADELHRALSKAC
jgi:hypothetical protein